MQLLLRGKGLWYIVSGTERAPPESDATGISKYVHRKDVALTDIILSIEDSCSHAVINMEDPALVWEKLQAMYKGVSDACIDTYLEKLQCLKMDEDEKIMEYVNRLVSVENDLAGVGHVLNEKDKIRALLRGLREEYEVTAKVIRAMNTSFTKAVSELVIEEGSQNSQHNQVVDTTATALATVHNYDKKTCSHCGRGGHVVDDCYHNPNSKSYRKGFKGKRKGPRNNKKPNQQKQKKQEGGAKDLSDVALVSKTVLNLNVDDPDSIKDKWMVDSACTSHMCNDESQFHTLRKTPCRSVQVGEGQHVTVQGIGTVQVISTVAGKRRNVVMKAVLFVPTMICSLISVSKARRSGCRVEFDADENGDGYCHIIDKASGSIYIHAHETKPGLYDASVEANRNHTAMLSAERSTWHKRMAHVSDKTLQRTAPMVHGMDLSTPSGAKEAICEDCSIGKSCRTHRPTANAESRNSTKPLELVHADIVGPIKPISLAGKKYFIPLYDDSSGVSLVRFLKTKDGAGAAIKDMITELETLRQTRIKNLHITCYDTEKIKRLRTDNGKEFLSNNFKKWLAAKGILHELTSAYSPESNGKAERLNRTLLDMARTMLLSAPQLPKLKQMWAEAVNTACYIRNRLFTSVSSVEKTPYEILLNKRPDISHIRVFGSRAYVHIPKNHRIWKLDKRAHAGFLVGFERGNSFRVYLPDEGKVVVSRDVTVDEHWTSPNISDKSLHNDTTQDDIEFDDPFIGVTRLQSNYNLNSGPTSEDDVEAEDHTEQVDDSEVLKNQNEDWQDCVTHFPGVRRSTRSNNPPERFGFDSALFVQEARMRNESSSTPLTYQEAVTCSNSPKWIAAMDEEINQIEKQQTWELVELPQGHKAVKCRWVYDAKLNSNDEITRYRARLVAKGFTQQKGINYDEVFSPVVKYSTIRFMLALASDEKLEMLLLDVKAAFLNGNLDETIFMSQPEGFIVKDKPHHVYRLLKALYGLKQASRAWRKVINEFLLDIGCVQSRADASLYFLRRSNGTVHILVYVDDILLLCKATIYLKELALQIAKAFEVRIERSVTKFLGMIVERDPVSKSIKIHSRSMIDQMMNKFGMENCKAVATPLPEGISLSVSQGPVNEGEQAVMNRTPYRQLVGCLLHLSNTTRPDIAFASGYLSRFMQNPGPVHWNAAKHVLRYLNGTRTTGIKYQKEQDGKLHGYSDSDFASDVDTRKSTSGYCFIYSGGCISWRSKKQTVVAQSTVEAEYVAISFAVREALWIRKIMVEIGKQDTTIFVGEDNQGALSLSKDEMENERSKHIDVKYHFIRDHIERGSVKMGYIPTNHMVADIMTKALGRHKHLTFSKKMGMTD